MRRFFLIVSLLFVGGILVAIPLVINKLNRIAETLPSHTFLADYEPPVMTRIHAGDGVLIAEYANEPRLFIPVEVVPKIVLEAFLSAEDKTFYSHYGINLLATARAAVTNISRYFNNRRPIGASTITQQVAKNFLLSPELSLQRKIKEAMLAIRIENALSKDRILELYLNEIFLGINSYGIAAAALTYFNKSIYDLTLEEAAYLAALPKAPNNYHPIKFNRRAVIRRNWVLRRMYLNGYITATEEKNAAKKPLVTHLDKKREKVVEDKHFTEEVRRRLITRFGKTEIYENGFSVHTTLDTNLQRSARRALRKGLIAYGQRHGWRGADTQIPVNATWPQRLRHLSFSDNLKPWRLAVVLDVNEKQATIGLRADSSPARQAKIEKGLVRFSDLGWQRYYSDAKRTKKTTNLKNLLRRGDVIYVEPIDSDDASDTAQHHYNLRQIPQIEGAVVVLDVHTGRVLALVGGFDFEASSFNRATQAQRQPGSTFKPFVYAAALEHGYQPNDIVIDAPIVVELGSNQDLWRPENYEKKFFGPATVRFGLEKSRNAMTVRLAQKIGLDAVVSTASRVGLYDAEILQVPSLVLGAFETSLIEITAAYATLVNGGKRVIPHVIDRVQDRYGKRVYRHDQRDCPDCIQPFDAAVAAPKLESDAPQVIDQYIAFQMVSMLEGVIKRGTGRALRQFPWPVAGKTGTTNNEQDAWFIGFTPDLAVGVYVGFDTPKPLGRRETGSRVALPIFRDVMTEALAGTPPIPFRAPAGIRFVRIDPKTGEAAGSDQAGIIEAFRPGSAVQPSDDRRGDTLALLDQFGGWHGDGSTAATTGSNPWLDPSSGPTPAPESLEPVSAARAPRQQQPRQQQQSVRHFGNQGIAGPGDSVRAPRQRPNRAL